MGQIKEFFVKDMIHMDFKGEGEQYLVLENEMHKEVLRAGFETNAFNWRWKRSRLISQFCWSYLIELLSHSMHSLVNWGNTAAFVVFHTLLRLYSHSGQTDNFCSPVLFLALTNLILDVVFKSCLNNIQNKF